MEDEKKYSSAGRVLRPRKSKAYDTQDSGSGASRRSFGENYGERREGGERRNYGDRKPYSREGGEHRGYGDRKPYSREGGERRSYGEHKPYSREGGEHRSYGDRKPYSSEGGGHRSYGDRKPYSREGGERRSYGEHKPYSREGGERRSYGERKPFSREGGEHKSYGERKSYGTPSGERKPYGERQTSFQKRGQKGGYRKNDYQFNENDESGIGRMLSNRSAKDSKFVSDNDMVSVPVRDEIRLNKFIANSGVCSRREADTMIQAGVVTVNGEVVTELGTKVNVVNDEVRFNGEILRGEEKVYIVMNKPKGYVTTASDPHADKTVIELLKGCSTRVFPVGRLDKNTTGVLMFTNDGEIAERLTHPSYDKKKIYQVILDHELRPEDRDNILSGITLSDGDIAADELEYIEDGDHRKLGIEIHSGKNRIVRRIFEAMGYEVRALDRVYFAGLTKKGLKKGEWRYLTEGEVNILKMGAYV